MDVVREVWRLIPRPVLQVAGGPGLGIPVRFRAMVEFIRGMSVGSAPSALPFLLPLSLGGARTKASPHERFLDWGKA